MIYQDCWDEVSSANSVYGQHALVGDELRVVVERGLDVWSERLSRHVREDGGVGIGRCELIFGGVSSYSWRETPFSRTPDGEVVWGESKTESFDFGAVTENEKYFLDGTTIDGSKTVWIEICALRFSLDAK